MVRGLMHSLQGTVQLEMKGFSPERFLNLCSLNGIEIWDLVYEDGRCRLSMRLPDFWKIRAFARKSGVRVKVTKRSGLPFFVEKNRKRKPSEFLLFKEFWGLFGMILEHFIQ